MRASLQENLIIIASEDIPNYKKGGSLVRNSFFWALKSIAGYSGKGKDWEFEQEVWIALARMLLFFTQSGYLGIGETILEFPSATPIPEVLQSVSTWL